MDTHLALLALYLVKALEEKKKNDSDLQQGNGGDKPGAVER